MARVPTRTSAARDRMICFAKSMTVTSVGCLSQAALGRTLRRRDGVPPLRPNSFLRPLSPWATHPSTSGKGR
jgi:hypothetical protein